MEQPKFNNKKCKEECNCIEIAEFKNQNSPVKNYPCLGVDINGFKLLEAIGRDVLLDDNENLTNK